MYKDIDCPYCETPQDINHDDGNGYEEGVRHEQQCGHCNKNFIFTTSISYYYDVEKADCLNDLEHNFKPMNTWPKECTKMRCTTCDKERMPTEQELQDILSEPPLDF